MSEEVLDRFVCVALSGPPVSRGYCTLLESLRTARGAALCRWHRALCAAVSLLDLEGAHSALLDALLLPVPEWTESLHALLVSLCTVHGGRVLARVIESLLLLHEEPVHCTLETLCKVHPAATGVLVQVLQERFPYWKANTETHTVFLGNALRVTQYLPAVRDRVIKLAVAKVMAIDVQGEEEMNKVDMMVDKVLQYLHQVQDMHAVFGSLVEAFEAFVLKTRGTQAVQFILLYYCSLNHLYYEIILKRLCERLFEPTESYFLRESCVFYIASFLSSAKYIRRTTVVHYWQLLRKWVHGYIDMFEQYVNDFRETTSKVDINELLSPDQHRVFYSVCNCLMHMFTHKFDSLEVILDPETFDSEMNDYEDDDEQCEDVAVTAEEKLVQLFEPLFASSLLVFQYCKSSVSLAFLNQCVELGLDYDIVHSTINRLKNEHKQDSESSLLHLPFDSCSLNVSFGFIQDIYEKNLLKGAGASAIQNEEDFNSGAVSCEQESYSNLLFEETNIII